MIGTAVAAEVASKATTSLDEPSAANVLELVPEPEEEELPVPVPVPVKPERLALEADDGQVGPQRQMIVELFEAGHISTEERDGMLAKMEAQAAFDSLEAQTTAHGKEAIALFNTKGSKKGVAHIMQNWSMLGLSGDPSAEAIAQLLKKKSAKGEFSKNEIGEFLGGGKELNIEVRKHYARTFDFKAMSFVASLRQFLSGFRLPGESMLIERIMYDFSVQFYLDNPNFCEHLTKGKLEEIRARFAECCEGPGEGHGSLRASALFGAIKGLDGDYKYMKNVDIAEMLDIEPREVQRMSSLGVEVRGERAVSEMIRDVNKSSTVAIAEDGVERATKKVADAIDGAVRAAQELDDAAPGDDIERLKSRLAHNKEEKGKKVLLAQAAHEGLRHAQKEASSMGDPEIDLAFLLAILARKMGVDTAFVLAYSTIQLNTDAHSPKLETRMSKQQFINNNRMAPDLANLSDDVVSELYDEITNEEIRILDEGVDMLEIAVTPSPRSRRRSPKADMVAPDLEKIGLKQYDVVQRGIKKAPKKIHVIVSQMGLTVLDSNRKPVTNVLYQKFGRCVLSEDQKALYITLNDEQETTIQLKTGNAKEINDEIDLATAAIAAVELASPRSRGASRAV